MLQETDCGHATGDGQILSLCIADMLQVWSEMIEVLQGTERHWKHNRRDYQRSLNDEFWG